MLVFCFLYMNFCLVESPPSYDSQYGHIRFRPLETTEDIKDLFEEISRTLFETVGMSARVIVFCFILLYLKVSKSNWSKASIAANQLIVYMCGLLRTPDESKRWSSITFGQFGLLH